MKLSECDLEEPLPVTLTWYAPGPALPGFTVRLTVEGKADADVLERLHVGPTGETAHPN